MKNWHRFREVPIVLALLAAFLGKFCFDTIHIGSQRPSPRVTRASAEFLAQSLLRFNFGFRNAIADMLWIELLQKASHKPLSRDEVSWEYAQLNAIVSLDRKFRRAYPFGAAFLSVFRRDRLGAQLILEKWTRYEPTYWKTHYLLGYHYFFEQKKYEEASRSILKAASFPDSPGWLTALGIRLMSESGAYFSAMQVALDLYPSISDIEGKYRLQKRIRSLRFTMLKAAWNRALKRYPEDHKRKPASTTDIVPLVKEELKDVAQAIGQLHIHSDLENIFLETFHFQYDPKTGQIQCTNGFEATEIEELEGTGIHRAN